MTGVILAGALPQLNGCDLHCIIVEMLEDVRDTIFKMARRMIAGTKIRASPSRSKQSLASLILQLRPRLNAGLNALPIV